MNRIKTSDILDPTIQQPFTGKSLFFLQDANKEMANALSKSVIQKSGYDPDAVVPYIVSTLTSDFYIFYVDELYKMSATASGNNIAVLTITDDPTADPVTFTDATPRNVHNIRTLVPTTGSLGAGLFDLVDLVDIQTDNRIFERINGTASYTINAGSFASFSPLSGLTYTTPSDGKTRRLSINFNCVVNTNINQNVANSGARARLYNSTTSTEYDRNEHLKAISDTFAYTTAGVYVRSIEEVGPGETVRVDAELIIGGVCTITRASLVIEEIF